MASFDQAGLEIYSDWFLIRGTKAPLEPNKLSGVLLQLAPGATAQQLRFGQRRGARADLDLQAGCGALCRNAGRREPSNG